MKVLVVQETDWIRNLPLQTHQIMEFLSKIGHEVRVVDFEANWESGNKTVSLRSRQFLDIHRTDKEASVRVFRPGMLKLSGISRLSSWMPQFKVIFEQMVSWCDIVVLYSVPTNGVQTILSSRLLSKPVIFHSYDVLHRMTGHSFLRAPTWMLERFVCRRANKIVVISAALANYMRDIGVPAQKVVLIPPAVDTCKFNPSVDGRGIRRELGIRDDEKVALFSGWLYDFCGIDLVFRAIEDLAQNIPRFRLVVCGDGPLLDTLVRLRAELGIERYVCLLGRRPFDDMPGIVAGADVCINPYLPDVRSIFAFPSKIAEYMAAGKSVIATNLDGTESILGKSSGAILVSPERFADAIRSVMTDDDLRQKLAEQCRNFCLDNFSLQLIAQRFESVLTETIASPY